MASGITNVVSESMEWISFEMKAPEKPLISSINPTRFEKLLGFTAPPRTADMESVCFPEYLHHQAYVADDLTDLVEEDVWGCDDDDASSVDDDNNSTPSSKQWLDTGSDSHFSALFDEGDGESRATGIFSPFQFSPLITSEQEAMRGRILGIMSLARGTSGVISGTHNTIETSAHSGILLSNESFVAGYGPRSASIEVPMWSKLRAMMKNGGTFFGLDVSDDDDDDDDDDDSVQRVPPHQLLAKQNAKSQVSAFSVIEGTGCTLKGRDVSKVRDAVWKKTGFSG